MSGSPERLRAEARDRKWRQRDRGRRRSPVTDLPNVTENVTEGPVPLLPAAPTRLGKMQLNFGNGSNDQRLSGLRRTSIPPPPNR
jgi:hypothetical protein